MIFIRYFNKALIGRKYIRRSVSLIVQRLNLLEPRRLAGPEECTGSPIWKAQQVCVCVTWLQYVLELRWEPKDAFC